MDLKRLKHLVALADCRNFGRAAELCNLSQSAFSRSIQAAEVAFNLRLFDRVAGEVQCTPAGNFVIERARNLLFQNKSLEQDISLYRERLIGDLTFGAESHLAATILPLLLTELRTQFSGVNLSVEINKPRYLTELLKMDKLDFYLADMSNISLLPEVEATHFGVRESGFYVRRGHPLLQHSSIQGEALLPYGLASASTSDTFRLTLGALMGLPQDTVLPLVLECDDLNLLKTIAMSTDTVIIYPTMETLHKVYEEHLVPLAITNAPLLCCDIGLASLKGRSYSLVSQYAINFLKHLEATKTQ